MFSTFRHRLLFWFLIFISTNLVTVWLSLRYLSSLKKIEETATQLEYVNNLLLKWVYHQQNYFSYDTKSDAYFHSGKSEYLHEYTATHQLVLSTLEKVRPQLSTQQLFDESTTKIKQADSAFQELMKLVQQRGYKNYGLEGAMRAEAHWLENQSTLATEKLLSLRRHEKDYIIRNDDLYVTRFNLLCNDLIKRPKDSTQIHLAWYQDYFNQLVKADRASGVKDNSALRAKLDNMIKELGLVIDRLVHEAKREEAKELRSLNIQFGGLVGLLFLGGVLLSYIIATRLTTPLKDLTIFITRFVESNFTVEEDNLFVKGRDEIGKLTQNFTVMKNEVITRLKFFKQKVDERTEELAQANNRLVKLNEAHKRFVPQEFLRLLNKPSIEDVELGDQIEQEMTVMFTDIRSFTQLSEQLSPQENFDFINTYLKKVVPVVEQHGGIIDKYIGDSVMALFPDSPLSAVQAAVALKEEVTNFNRGWTMKGNEPIAIGIGIHTGRLILGTIGHDKRIQTTVISDAVNIASRVEGLTKYYGITTLITNDTLNRLPDHSIDYRFIDIVKVKGKSNSLSIYEVLEKSEVEKISTKKEFERALLLLRERRLAEANTILAQLHTNQPNDLTISLFLNRCQHYLVDGLPDEWDGIEVMKSK